MQNSTQNIINYIMRSALRSHTLRAAYILLLCSLIMCVLLGQMMLIEQSQFAVVFFANIARFLLNFGLVVFITLNIYRIYNSKELEMILSKNVSRGRFILSYYLSIMLLNVCMVLPILVVLQMMQIFVGVSINLPGLLVWTASLFIETVTISTFTLLMALLIRSSIFCLLYSGLFYIVCRIYGVFVSAIQSDLSDFAETLRYIGIIFPRLDVLIQSEWLLYGMPPSQSLAVPHLMVIANCLICAAFLLFITVVEFRKREI